MQSRLNIETLLRRTYTLHGTWEGWLQGLVEVLEPSYPPGVSFQACALGFNHEQGSVFSRRAYALAGDRDAKLSAIFEQAAAAGMGQLAYPLLSKFHYLTPTEAGIWTPEGIEIFRAAGVRDFVGLIGTSLQGGLILGTLQESVVPRAPGSRRTWLGVGRHLQAGLRARERLEEATALCDADAVFDTSGQLIEARGGARLPEVRERLRGAVIARERSADWYTLDAPEALARWQDLTAGRWSLLDHFEASGRRYVLALRNDPVSAETRALSRSEALALEGAAIGRPYKVIAGALDVSLARVHQLVGIALAKLGLSNVADLTLCVRSRGPRWLAFWPLGEETLAALRYPAASTEALTQLTPAERQVVGYLVAGKSYSDIAIARGSSRRTVSNQVASIYAKLGVGSRLELVARFAAQ